MPYPSCRRRRLEVHSGATIFVSSGDQIDGIGVDSDVIFLMTTNRAGLLEPALAARPGRVDQAVAIPLPGRRGRARQLLDLYCRGLEVELRDDTAVIEATDGVSAAFIREPVRKAALLAARDGDETLTDLHFPAALDLLAQGGVTRAMLGGAGAEVLEALDEQAGSWIVTAHGQAGGLGVSEHLAVDDDWEDED